MKTNTKLKRMSKVLSMAFIIFIQIYWYKICKKREEEWKQLWIHIGRRFRKTVFELEGLLIKVGQILSIRSDLLPTHFIEQIQDLTDKVPASKWTDIEKILEKEWGSPIEDQFLTINKETVASASIGEVYKGVLKNGTSVAIKVQRPNIQSIMQTDFRTLQIIIWFADRFVPLPKDFINLKVLYKEIKQVIERELDFMKEQETLISFKERFKDLETVQIPAVYSGLSTQKVLVMEWVEGVKFTDTHALNQLGLNRDMLAKQLIQVFLPQWLEPGTFHADPHPGNVLVSKEGKIVLLDFGMVAEISKRDATYFQDLIESYLSKNYAKAVEALINLGFFLPEAEPRTMERLIAELMSIQPSQMKEMDLVALKLEINQIIEALPIQVPTRFVFLGRSFITIEGILQTLVTEDELIEIGKPVFLDWLRNQGNGKWSFLWKILQSQPIFKGIHSFTEFLNFPEKLEQIKEMEQRRMFQFTMYENHKKHFFQLILVSVIGGGLGIYSSQSLLFQISIGLAAVSSIGYLIQNYKLKKWLRFMHKKRGA